MLFRIIDRHYAEPWRNVLRRLRKVGGHGNPIFRLRSPKAPLTILPWLDGSRARQIDD